MRFAVRVEVRSLEGIADPEGQTIERALPALGFRGVEAVHMGKLFRFVLEADSESAARATADQMCSRLLANPVIEQADVWVEPLGADASDEPAVGRSA
ncbi:MAG: phosphoribosylformylglycinamidine synthase, purS protein [Acidimicrobiaceae bacterium]|nr:phosphoribosylformylglycinamidine synthase, purS protein [Acidimicrobiaceae bacterium]